MRKTLAARGRHNALKRYREPDDPELIAAARALDVESLAEHAQRVVAAWPELEPEQRDRLAALLAPVQKAGAA